MAPDFISYAWRQTEALFWQSSEDRRRAEFIADRSAETLRRPEIAKIVGSLAGLASSRMLCPASKFHGWGMRASIASVAEETLPDFYVFGGQAERATLASAERYSEAFGCWEALPPMPTARSFCAAVAVGGKIFVFGGERDQRSAFAAAEAFDPALGEWERLPPMPTPRAGCAAAACGGAIYVCGGLVVAGEVLGTAECFCLHSYRWRRLPPMPTSRCGCAAAACGGDLYVFGGQLEDGTVLSLVERFQPQTKRWSAAPAMPGPRSGFAAVTVGGLVHLIGGLGGQGLSVAVVDRFDPVGAWLVPLPVPLSFAGGAVGVAGHSIWVAGGFSDDRMDSARACALEVSREGGSARVSLRSLPPLNCPRRLCAGAAIWRYDASAQAARQPAKGA